MRWFSKTKAPAESAPPEEVKAQEELKKVKANPHTSIKIHQTGGNFLSFTCTIKEGSDEHEWLSFFAWLEASGPKVRPFFTIEHRNGKTAVSKEDIRCVELTRHPDATIVEDNSSEDKD